MQEHPRSDEGYCTHHVAPVVPCHPPSPSPQHEVCTPPNQNMQSMSPFNLENKGHKKWLGEVIEVAEEAAE